MAVATGVGWGIGYWLDGEFGTGPWLMLVFLLFGIAAGFKGLLRTAREIQDQTASKTAPAESPRTDPESKP